ncbi:MAG: beta-propeller fold lactonase family protein [Gemmatimonas sp.]
MKRAAITLALFTLGACNSDSATAPVSDNAASSLARSDNRSGDNRDTDDDERGDQKTGVVFILSNQTTGNAVLAYNRHADGTLTAAGSVPTNGTGTGAGLGSAGALAYSPDGKLLFVVNAGSNSITSFRVHDDQLTRVSTMASGGIKPISLTANNDGMVYVLNAGGTGNIAGLHYSNNGTLSTLAGSSRALSTGASDPAQISFTEDGNRLIVTEKGTNVIGTFYVTNHGFVTPGQFRVSSGATPFGFAVSGDDIIVSEAFGGAADASAVSSYRVGFFGTVATISASVPTTETSACWIAVTSNGKLAFSANTGSGTVTAFDVGRFGNLSRIPPDGVSATTGAGSAPADLAVSQNNRYLYVRNGGNRTISAIRVHANGTLTVLGITGDLPAGTVGLVAN